MLFRELVYEETESTNKVVKRAIEDGEAEGLVVRAWRQTGAYGRRDSMWSSPEGGLYLSVLLRPDAPVERLSTLPLIAGLAVRDALASLVTSDQARRIKVKWPNDVVVEPSREEELLFTAGAEVSAVSRGAQDAGGPPVSCVETPGLAAGLDEVLAVEPQSPLFAGYREGAAVKKLVGISSELHRGGFCLGVGVNVEPPSAPSEVAGRNLPAYLFDLGFGFICDRRSGIDAVARAVLAELGAAYERWLSEGFSLRAAEYDERSFLRGRFVEITGAGTEPLTGEVAGVDEFGRLLLLREDGAVRAVASGEAHVILRA